LSADSPKLPASAERYEDGMLNFPSIYALGESVGLILETGSIPLSGEYSAWLMRPLTLWKIWARPLRIVTPISFPQSGRTGPPRRGALRVSPHFYNDESDLEALQTAITDTL
jgi:selenocysteine lyase/cysteine desulfurase